MLHFTAQQCQNGDVRLAGGPNQFEGRLEYCVNGNWGQVCSMGWNTADAAVVCHQLGHSSTNRELENCKDKGTSITYTNDATNSQISTGQSLWW